ncbi:MAG TPA: transglutaminase-like domain-containing protein [Planctomycetota bacterium]|nr:transglutaminase-like domain-containing protein [Planctomycetota bacterium]
MRKPWFTKTACLGAVLIAATLVPSPAADATPPAEVLPPPPPPPAPPTVTPATPADPAPPASPVTPAPPAPPAPPAAGGDTAEVGQILLPENFEQHFLVYQGKVQIGVEVDRSQIQLVKGSRFVAESIEEETAFSAGGGSLHRKSKQSWVRDEAGFPTACALVLESDGSRTTVDGEWDVQNKQFVCRIGDGENNTTRTVPIPHPTETVLELDGVILHHAGELKEGGDLTRYILILHPPTIGLGRERARVIKKDTGPEGHGIVYTLEISDASQPDGTPAPNAPLPKRLTVNELGQPLERIAYPMRWLAVRPDLAKMPTSMPVFANSLKPVPADPQHPVPTRVADVDRLERSFFILSAPALPGLSTSPYQEVALTRDQDRTVAVVKLRTVRPDGRVPMTVLTADERKIALAPTSKIQSDHRDIKARADSLVTAVLKQYADREAAANRPATVMPAADRDYAVARMIAAWVYRRLAKDASGPADASALHALYYMRGDCTEHANLVVALARASGIPARICRGLVLEEGELNAHQWAEVFLAGYGGTPLDPPVLKDGDVQGLWLPVDATLDRWGVPAAYLLLSADEVAFNATMSNLMFDGDAVWMTGAKTPAPGSTAATPAKP